MTGLLAPVLVRWAHAIYVWWLEAWRADPSSDRERYFQDLGWEAFEASLPCKPPLAPLKMQDAWVEGWDLAHQLQISWY